MGIQLYSHLKHVKIPGNAWLSSRQTYVYRDKTLDNLPLFRWPDGRLCHLANQWIMNVSSATKARDTARVYASQITHMIRYCFFKKIEIFELNDNHFYEFTQYLKNNIIKNAAIGGELVGRNHVRAVQLRCLYFLVWISKQFGQFFDHCLIGTEDQSPSIVITWRINRYSGRLDIFHPDLVVSEPYKDDKAVITEAVIRDIQNTIYNMSLQRQRFLNMSCSSKNHSEVGQSAAVYLYERRMFTIRMMKLTGLRPEELVDIPLDLNDDVISSLKISIPTKKQGVPAPIRKFNITLRAALDFNRYLKARKDYIQVLALDGEVVRGENSILLTDRGKSLAKESLTREFARICEQAKFNDMRTCLSMFRHRFITREIHTLLLLRFERDSSLKISWTEGLRDDICFIVKQKTGHRNIESLYEYFHSEYDLLTGKSDRVSSMNQRDRLDAAQEALVDLKFKSHSIVSSTIEQDIQKLELEVESLYKKIYGVDE
ncbi:hypothetical protein KJF94_08905 [Pseudomonas hormoni]|uniref:Site-specific integrase n=1 Tax=Pseudomonas hormoni TaxID=3093767 RepID=A0ABX8F1E3_9PSED|nr:hypothetical protein [Pseudomonas hormoni]QVW25647.1 hypothetical protein KJF94_08905 [Pseudomonas hormoni]